MSETSDEGETPQALPESETSESQEASDTPAIKIDGGDDLIEEPEAWEKMASPVPVRIQLNFTAMAEFKGAVDVMEVLDTVVGEAERRGFFIDFTHSRPMDEDEVVPGSELAQALSGAEAAS